MTRKWRFGVLVALLVVGSVACGSGGGSSADDPPPVDPPPGDPSAAASEPAAPETAAPEATPTAAATEAVVADELPAFLSDFDRVCTTQVGFSGAAAYNKEPRVHTVALFEEYREDDDYLETSRTLPKPWVVEQDDDFADNSELAAIELIGCLDRVKETRNGTKCDFDSDGKTVTLELVDTRSVLTVYEAATGAEVGSERLVAKSDECPSFVSFQEGDTTYFNDPSDDQIIKALKPFVNP